MGYTTTFNGHMTVEPPLSAEEAEFLHRFSETRHCVHQASKWAATGGHGCPPGKTGSCTGHYRENPGYWCQWVPGLLEPDGTFSTIEWDGREKFYDAEEWMRFIIEEFLKPSAGVLTSWIPIVNGMGVTDAHIVFNGPGHILNGVIDAQGEESDDRWRLVVRNNVVTVQQPEIVWPDRAIAGPTVITGHVVYNELES